MPDPVNTILDPNTSTKRRNVKILEELTKRVSIRETHLNLYRILMVMAIMFIALAVNLYYSKPTFNPYGIEKEVIALVFSVLGVSKIIALNFYHNLKLVRLIVGFSTGFMIFWGISNTQQAFAGKASFQLPILLITLALINLLLLVEPVSNPLTANGNDNEKKK